MRNKLQYGGVSCGTSTGSASATAVIGAVTGKQHIVAALQASSDTVGCIVEIKDGTTVIWSEVVGAGVCDVTFPTGLPLTSGRSCNLSVAGTTTCAANIQVVTM